MGARLAIHRCMEFRYMGSNDGADKYEARLGEETIPASFMQMP